MTGGLLQCLQYIYVTDTVNYTYMLHVCIYIHISTIYTHTIYVYVHIYNIYVLTLSTIL